MSDGARVALTFDAEHPDRPWCPHGNAERILDALAAADVRATFFVQGRWAESQPATAKRIADDGHLIGHHSFYHARMPLLLGGGFESDVMDGQEAIAEITGRDPRPWFRCPFGEGHDDARILASLEKLGYRNVHWNVQAEDWEPESAGDLIVSRVTDGVREHGDGSVVLLHTWPGGTGDAIEPLLRELSGTEFVTIDELEDLP